MDKKKTNVMKSGIELIAEERQRQIEKGYNEEHDAQHEVSKLLSAAKTYIGAAALTRHSKEMDDSWRKYNEPWEWRYLKTSWPWEIDSFKPSTELRDLEKAGALIAAAIDRLQMEPKAAEVADRISKL